ncbi:MAG: M15 family metallopeptidase [Candidatus Saccharimonadales bacterium]
MNVKTYMRRHTKHAIVVMVIVIVGGGVVSLFLALRPDEATAPAVSKTSQPAVAKPDDTVTISLPGATPITAITQDYDDPSSLWVVISKEHPISKPDYRPRDLAIAPTSVATNTAKSIDEQSMRQTIFEPTVSLFADAKKAGHDIMIASGFRSYELQRSYFDNYSRVSGEEAANKYSARPGQSEHQTGIAFDISLSSRECYLETCFGETSAGRWLAAHAHEYGFILRYPDDKTEITQYQYEPWHFRYVGKDLAGALTTSGLTLDEAYPYLQSARQSLRDQKRI